VAVRSFLRVERLRKAFGSTVALNDITLDVAEGEFVSFLGPSGCGKTTLLRLIAGLERHDAGRIEIGGRDVSSLPTSARDVGIVFQSYALFPHLTAFENVAYGLRAQRAGRDAIRARVGELLELIGLGHLHGRYAAQLSGGEQQRVALARALALSPALLLLDEPLSALDAKVRVSLRGELKELQRRVGITTIMVTHDQEEALTMADRVVVMDHGNIQQIGTPRQVYREPANTFVASFVGHMNLLAGEALGGGLVRVGGTVAEMHALGVRAGAVRLAIRPEDVALGRNGSTPAGGLALPATVVRSEYLGAYVRIRLTTEAGEGALVVDLPAREVDALPLIEGARVTATLPTDRLIVIDG